MVDSQTTNPRELLVASTFPLVDVGELCGPFYDHLIDHMGKGEGLVSVRERLGNSVAGPPEFPARPEHFQLEPAKPERGGCGLASHEVVQRWWIPFRDEGRDFYAEVVIGTGAPDSLRLEAAELLDSLRVDEY